MAGVAYSVSGILGRGGGGGGNTEVRLFASSFTEAILKVPYQRQGG